MRWFLMAWVAALASLVAARFLTSPHWIVALWVTFVFAALAVGIGLRLLSRRLLPMAPPGLLALMLGAVAVMMRFQVTTSLRADPARMTKVVAEDMWLVGASLCWGALALIWGTRGIAAAVEMDTFPKHGKSRLILAGSATICGLFALAPLRHPLGIGVNHWTLIGLLLLALLAYGIDRLHGALWRRDH